LHPTRFWDTGYELILKNHQNIYELRFEQSIASGLSITDAAIMITELYLDGKPIQIKVTERNVAFWTCQFLATLSTDVYETEPFILALVRYMSQKHTANVELLHHIAQIAPESVRQAVKYSGLILRQDSERWTEIEQLATIDANEFAEFVKICHIFDYAYRERVAEIEHYRKQLAGLSPLELLSYASLYAFEHLLSDSENIKSDSDTQEIWDAMNDILIWKLKNSTDKSFHLTEAVIGNSLRIHLSPFLFPSPENSKVCWNIYPAFKDLLLAQVELNSFLSRSVDAFCYDDAISFELVGTTLEIVERDTTIRTAWDRDGKKLARLHNYWYYRAWCVFHESGMSEIQIGSIENHEWNQRAYVKAIRTQLRLTEVYGLDETVQVETGLRVDLFRALLSLELMSAFYNTDFVTPYNDHLNETGHWRLALTRLAMGGLLLPDPQNRFPITFSKKQDKIKKIQGWTVSKDFPHGHAKAAEAILDFWTSDLKDLSTRLRNGEATLQPNLCERPLLKIGHYLFELPWITAMQNNSTAALNNLRRIGARRLEAGEETRRIEKRLAEYFEARGFRVCLNYHPEKTLSDNAGEIDLICIRDGQLLVLEVKSTFLRQSQKEAWFHKTTALRKAGLQLRRKVRAVQAALFSDANLALVLGMDENTEMPAIHGWIVDTSIEYDHQLFSGFLKVSLEEVLIALRDDRHWLNDPFGLFTGQPIDINTIESSEILMTSTLYPDGFSGGRFVDVIERQAVWENNIESPFAKL
jgi:hypothetical protein